MLHDCILFGIAVAAMCRLSGLIRLYHAARYVKPEVAKPDIYASMLIFMQAYRSSWICDGPSLRPLYLLVLMMHW